MKKLCTSGLVSLILVSLFACETPQKPSTEVVTEKAAVPFVEPPGPRVQAELEQFVAVSYPNRGVGQKGHSKAFKYLKEQFDSIVKTGKGKVFIHKFSPDIGFAIKNYQNDFDTLVKSKFKKNDPTYIKWKKFTDAAIAFVNRYRKIKGQNLILELPGDSESTEVIYLGAHYDTITHNHETMAFTPKEAAPGADDNASAIAALLKTARTFSLIPHHTTLRFVAFDYEEIFFLGSYAFAKDLAAKKLPWVHASEQMKGLINLEMLGWSTRFVDGKSIVKIYTRIPDAKGYEQDMRLAKAFETASQSEAPHLRPEILSNGFNRSDNWSFWQKDLPSICISEDWEEDFNEKNYHTKNDLPSSINYEYLNQITTALIKSISILESPN